MTDLERTIVHDTSIIDPHQEIVDRFERAHAHDAVPSVVDYLVGAGAERFSLHFRLLAVALEIRLRRGESIRLLHLLPEDPPLRRFSHEIIALLEIEIELRRECDPRHPPLLAEYLADYGELADRLPGLFRRAGVSAAEVSGYDVQCELGKGAFGVVYRAIERELNRPVALKVLQVQHLGDADQRDRFLHEARVMAAIRHPHVAQVYAVGETEGLPYLSMEFVEGGTLEQRLGQGRLLEPSIAAALLEKIARGVHAAHQQGMVHRDLKPANILMTPDGEPKVADFGLAKHLEPGSEHSHALVGTPQYMAPEQAAARSESIGPPTDVFALGTIFYQMLSGRLPFTGESREDLLANIAKVEPPPLRDAGNHVPRDLETICQKCHRKDPESRYPTAEALADDLRRFLEGRPIVARPVGRVEKTWKWVKRNPVVASLLSLAASSMIAITILSLATAREREKTIDAERKMRAESQSRLREQQRAAARLAARDGHWAEVLILFDSLTTEGIELDAAARFDQAFAYYQVGRPSDSRQAFERLISDESLPPDLSARVSLHYGELLYGRDDVRAESLITQSIESGHLPAGENLYAKALLTPSSFEAKNLFTEAQRLSPYLQEARSFATYLNLFFGEMATAEDLIKRSDLLFPDWSDTILLKCFHAALRSDRQGLEILRPKLIEILGTEEATNDIDACLVLASLTRAVDHAADQGVDDPFNQPELAAILERLNGREEIVAGSDPNLDVIGWRRSGELGNPPSLRCTKNFLKLLVEMRSGLLEDSSTSPEKLDALRKRLNSEFGSSLNFIVGLIELMRANGYIERLPALMAIAGTVVHRSMDLHYKQLLRQTAESFETAYQSKFFVDFRTLAFNGAVMVKGLLGSPRRWFDPEPAMVKRAAALLNERLGNGQPFRSNKWWFYSKVAIYSEDWKLADIVASRWMETDPMNQEARKAKREAVDKLLAR